MKITQNKEVYEAPRAEIAIVFARDILTDSTSKPKDPDQTEIDWLTF